MSSQPSRIFELWRRLYTRFLIEPLPAQMTDQPSVSTMIVPITDADELLIERTIQSVDRTITAPGQFLAYTVPAGKRATIRAASLFQLTGTYTIDAWLLVDGTTSVTLQRLASVTASATNFEGQQIKAETGWQLRVNVDAESVNGDLRLGVLVEEEDAF